VSPRYVALVVAAVLVMGLGVYLFVEVRAAPAPVTASAGRTPPPPPAPREEAPAPALDEPKLPSPTVGKPFTATRPLADIRVNGERQIRLGTTDLTQAPGDEPKANPRLDAIMDEANKAYDRSEFDDAKAIAGKVLTKQPGNIRMLRIMVSSSCIDGDVAVAQKYYPQLPKFDREQMKARCDRYGVTLTDPPQ